MVDLKGIMTGVVYWLIGNFVMYVTLQFFPQLLDTMTNATDCAVNASACVTATQSAFFSLLGWMAMLVVWVVAVLIVPILTIIKAAAKSQPGLPTILGAIVVWVFGFLYVITQYQYIGSLATLIITDSNGAVNYVVAIFFWLSTILTWGAVLVIVPIYLIYRGYHGDKIEAAPTLAGVELK